MNNRSLLITLVILTGTLLSNCSSPAPTSTTTAPEESADNPTAKFPYGSKVDSLNGIAGHTFGQPLSAFPKMELIPTNPGVLTRTYSQQGGKQSGWFGKHRQQVPIQLYWFLDGKFCHFRAVGDPATLRAEAMYLLGPGQTEGQYQLFWEGSQARAVYREQARGLGMEGTLDILSKSFEAEQAAQEKARLSAENAQ